MEATYKVSGMSCNGCVKSVRTAVERIAPHARVEVTLETGELFIDGDHRPDEVREAIEDAGFDLESHQEG